MSDAEGDLSKGDLFKAWYAGVLPGRGVASLARYFTDVGSWDLNFGDAQQTFLGSRFVNTFGNDSRLVFSPLCWLPGPFNRNPIMDFLLGLGDDVSFCYGSRIQATYGGPAAIINRCPRITKNGSHVRLAGGPGFDLLGKAYDAVGDYDDHGSDQVGREDRNVAKAVIAFHVILNLCTTIIDYWAHFTYEQYDPQTGKWSLIEQKKGDLATELGKLELAHRLLPRRIMAIIYHLETCCIWSGGIFSINTHLKGLAEKMAALVLVVATFGLAIPLILAIAFDASKKIKIVLGIITVLLIVVFAVIAIVALAA